MEPPSKWTQGRLQRCSEVIEDYEILASYYDNRPMTNDDVRLRLAGRRAVTARLGTPPHRVTALVCSFFRKYDSILERAVLSAIRFNSQSVESAARRRLPAWVRRADIMLQRLPKIVRKLHKPPKQPPPTPPSPFALTRWVVEAVLAPLHTALENGRDWTRAVQDVAHTARRTEDQIQNLWSRIRCVSIQKFRLLCQSADRPHSVPSAASMTPLDWLATDLLYMYTDEIIITQESLRSHSELSTLTALFSLVQKFGLDGEQTTWATEEQWKMALSAYQYRGCESSLVVLQRRWWELVKLTRESLAAYCRGSRDRVPPLLSQMAIRFPWLLTRYLPSWSELVRSRAIHKHTVEHYIALMKRRDHNGETNQQIHNPTQTTQQPDYSRQNSGTQTEQDGASLPTTSEEVSEIDPLIMAECALLERQSCFVSLNKNKNIIPDTSLKEPDEMNSEDFIFIDDTTIFEDTKEPDEGNDDVICVDDIAKEINETEVNNVTKVHKVYENRTKKDRVSNQAETSEDTVEDVTGNDESQEISSADESSEDKLEIVDGMDEVVDDVGVSPNNSAAVKNNSEKESDKAIDRLVDMIHDADSNVNPTEMDTDGNVNMDLLYFWKDKMTKVLVPDDPKAASSVVQTLSSYSESQNKLIAKRTAEATEKPVEADNAQEYLPERKRLKTTDSDESCDIEARETQGAGKATSQISQNNETANKITFLETLKGNTGSETTELNLTTCLSMMEQLDPRRMEVRVIFSDDEDGDNDFDTCSIEMHNAIENNDSIDGNRGNLDTASQVDVVLNQIYHTDAVNAKENEIMIKENLSKEEEKEDSDVDSTIFTINKNKIFKCYNTGRQHLKNTTLENKDVVKTNIDKKSPQKDDSNITPKKTDKLLSETQQEDFDLEKPIKEESVASRILFSDDLLALEDHNYSYHKVTSQIITHESVKNTKIIDKNLTINKTQNENETAKSENITFENKEKVQNEPQIETTSSHNENIINGIVKDSINESLIQEDTNLNEIQNDNIINNIAKDSLNESSIEEDTNLNEIQNDNIINNIAKDSLNESSIEEDTDLNEIQNENRVEFTDNIANIENSDSNLADNIDMVKGDQENDPITEIGQPGPDLEKLVLGAAVPLCRVDDLPVWERTEDGSINLNENCSKLSKNGKLISKAYSNDFEGRRLSKEYDYESVDLSKNPDFDVLLKNMSTDYFEKNSKLIETCVPVTVDLERLPIEISNAVDESCDEQESEYGQARVRLLDMEEVRRRNRTRAMACVRPLHNHNHTVTSEKSDTDSDTEMETDEPVDSANMETEPPQNTEPTRAPSPPDVTLTPEELQRALDNLKSTQTHAQMQMHRGRARVHCCHARRHVQYNAARRRQAAAGRKQPPPDIDLHGWSHKNNKCDCCCAHLLTSEPSLAYLAAAEADLKYNIRKLIEINNTHDETPDKKSHDKSLEKKSHHESKSKDKKSHDKHKSCNDSKSDEKDKCFDKNRHENESSDSEENDKANEKNKSHDKNKSRDKNDSDGKNNSQEKKSHSKSEEKNKLRNENNSRDSDSSDDSDNLVIEEKSPFEEKSRATQKTKQLPADPSAFGAEKSAEAKEKKRQRNKKHEKEKDKEKEKETEDEQQDLTKEEKEKRDYEEWKRMKTMHSKYFYIQSSYGAEKKKGSAEKKAKEKANEAQTVKETDCVNLVSSNDEDDPTPAETLKPLNKVVVQIPHLQRNPQVMPLTVKATVNKTVTEKSYMYNGKVYKVLEPINQVPKPCVQTPSSNEMNSTHNSVMMTPKIVSINSLQRQNTMKTLHQILTERMIKPIKLNLQNRQTNLIKDTILPTENKNLQLDALQNTFVQQQPNLNFNAQKQTLNIGSNVNVVSHQNTVQNQSMTPSSVPVVVHRNMPLLMQPNIVINPSNLPQQNIITQPNMPRVNQVIVNQQSPVLKQNALSPKRVIVINPTGVNQTVLGHANSICTQNLNSPSVNQPLPLYEMVPKSLTENTVTQEVSSVIEQKPGDPSPINPSPSAVMQLNPFGKPHLIIQPKLTIKPLVVAEKKQSPPLPHTWRLKDQNSSQNSTPKWTAPIAMKSTLQPVTKSQILSKVNASTSSLKSLLKPVMTQAELNAVANQSGNDEPNVFLANSRTIPLKTDSSAIQNMSQSIVSEAMTPMQAALGQPAQAPTQSDDSSDTENRMVIDENNDQTSNRSITEMFNFQNSPEEDNGKDGDDTPDKKPEVKDEPIEISDDSNNSDDVNTMPKIANVNSLVTETSGNVPNNSTINTGVNATANIANNSVALTNIAVNNEEVGSTATSGKIVIDVKGMMPGTLMISLESAPELSTEDIHTPHPQPTAPLLPYHGQLTVEQFISGRDPTKLELLSIDGAKPCLRVPHGDSYCLVITERRLLRKDPIYWTLENSPRIVVFNRPHNKQNQDDQETQASGLNLDCIAKKIDVPSNSDGNPQGRLKVKSFAKLSQSESESANEATAQSADKNLTPLNLTDEIYFGDKLYKKLSSDPLIYAQVWSVITDLSELRGELSAPRGVWLLDWSLGTRHRVRLVRAASRLGLSCFNYQPVVMRLVEMINEDLKQRKEILLQKQNANIIITQQSGNNTNTPNNQSVVSTASNPSTVPKTATYGIKTQENNQTIAATKTQMNNQTNAATKSQVINQTNAARTIAGTHTDVQKHPVVIKRQNAIPKSMVSKQITVTKTIPPHSGLKTPVNIAPKPHIYLNPPPVFIKPITVVKPPTKPSYIERAQYKPPVKIAPKPEANSQSSVNQTSDDAQEISNVTEAGSTTQENTNDLSSKLLSLTGLTIKHVPRDNMGNDTDQPSTQSSVEIKNAGNSEVLNLESRDDEDED